MGRKSVKKNKNIYQLSRENAGITREEAGDRMLYVTEDRLEKIENERMKAKPEDVIEMSRCYNDPLLCNKHCTNICPIGITQIPVVKEKDLPQLTVSIINAINNLNNEKDYLLGIAAGSNLTEESIDKLISIGYELSSLRSDFESLKLFLRNEFENNNK